MLDFWLLVMILKESAMAKRFEFVEPKPANDKSPTQRQQKRTQTNPLRLRLLESVRYFVFGENEPIDVKWPFCNDLERKKARFLKNMDEMLIVTIPDLFRKSKIETLRITSKAGMCCRFNRYSSRMRSLFRIAWKGTRTRSRQHCMEPGAVAANG